MANCNGPRKCKGFRTFKERGEWVELQFMAWVLRKGLKVTKPWGDSSSYDVGVEHGRQFLRVQVKSTSYRLANGYLCGFRPNQRRKRYARRKVDFFAAYIVPEEVWYVIPAAVVLRTKSSDLMLCPVQPMRRDCYKYESYRDAWKLLRTRKRKQTPPACHPEEARRGLELQNGSVTRTQMAGFRGSSRSRQE